MDNNKKDEICQSELKVVGKYKVIHMNSDREVLGVDEFHNIVVDSGLTYLGQILAKQAPQSLYISLFSGNYTPVNSDTAATFPASASEFTGYAEGNRVLWNAAAPSSGTTVTNSANKAEFNITTAGTVYGIALSTSPNKLGTTGTLFSAKKSTAPKSVSIGDILLVQYDLTFASA